jgi:3-dehydroquinate dehydratase/shikimate dehydrogenase
MPPMASAVVTLETERLVLRDWRPGDWEPFAALNADPRVMEWFPATLSRRESDALADSIEQRLAQQGWGLWAVEVPGVAEFIGFVGLNPAQPILGYPAVEVAWRLACEHWGRGYAPEAASASLAYGFSALGLEEIVSFTTVANAKSRRVMEKIGMTRDGAADFDHPRIAKGSPIRPHVLYRISRSQFEQHASR